VGVLQQNTRDLWERATGQSYPDVAGVEVSLAGGAGGSVGVEVSFVLDARHPATQVAVAVQRAVAAAVSSATGLPVSGVAVYISDIETGVRPLH
jgi:uncharacterized alkaline shock family protein YloU